MNAITTDYVRRQMRSYYDSVALNTALELGLFWLLAAAPQTAGQVAESLGIPVVRCEVWMDLLAGLGYLERNRDRFFLTKQARQAILETFNRETWQHLAAEERLRYPFGVDLARHMGHPLSVWAGQNRMPHNYLLSIAEDPTFAFRFSHMLYELHQPLAREVAATLDMQHVRRMMDLGGGSGVMSLALLERHPTLSAVVVDHPHVCAAGREIADATAMRERIDYHPADFLNGALPTGFDLVLECDVGIYSEALFGKVWQALNPGGRLVIIDEFSSPQAPTRLEHQRYAFYHSLTEPLSARSGRSSIHQVQTLLARAGFQLSVEQSLGEGTFILQGRK
jgi:3-hydroxy-5-methyl-1-naphthoate 3-O-methyltransferase